MVTGDTIMHVKTGDFGYTALKSFDDLKSLDKDTLKEYVVFTNDGYRHFNDIRTEYNVNRLIQFKFSDGYELKCTEDHKLLTYDNDYVEAKDLKIGDSFAGFGVSIKNIDYIDDNVYPVYTFTGIDEIDGYFTGKVISQC